MSRSPNGEPNPQNLGFVNFNSFTPTDVEKFSEFNGELFSKSVQNGGDIVRKLDAAADPGKRTVILSDL